MIKVDATHWTHHGEPRSTYDARIRFGLRCRPTGAAASIDVSAFRFHDGLESIGLTLYGPRGGYRCATSLGITEGTRLESQLRWLADFNLPYRIEPTEGRWSERVVLEQIARSRRYLTIQGPRAEHGRAQLSESDCHDLAAALRFVREHLASLPS